MFKITITNFTGQVLPLSVDSGTTIAGVKDAIANASFSKVRKSEICLTYNDHELRNHRPLSHYSIFQGYTLKILPPSRHNKITLNFERYLVPNSHFTLMVDPNITVAQLKREISIEEGVEVIQLKYLVLHQKSCAWRVCNIVPTYQDLDDGSLISEYSLQYRTIFVHSETYSITVKYCDTKATIHVEASKPIERLKTLLSHQAGFPLTGHLSVSWEGRELDENKSFAYYRIPSGAQLDLGPGSIVLALPLQHSTTSPISCTILLVTSDRQIHTIPIRLNDRLREFREAIYLRYPVPKSVVTLIFDGRRLLGESTRLKDLRIIPGSVIRAGDSSSLSYIELLSTRPSHSAICTTKISAITTTKHSTICVAEVLSSVQRLRPKDDTASDTPPIYGSRKTGIQNTDSPVEQNPMTIAFYDYTSQASPDDSSCR